MTKTLSVEPQMNSLRKSSMGLEKKWGESPSIWICLSKSMLVLEMCKLLLTCSKDLRGETDSM